MDEHETSCTHNLAETCCASIDLTQLHSLIEDSSTKPASASDLFPASAKLTYGNIRGNDALRKNLANLYSSKAASPLPQDNILITPGAIAANHLVFLALVGPGDHVIVHHPTYQQLYEVPKSLGAEVSLWEAKAEKDWVPDLEEGVGSYVPMFSLHLPHVPSHSPTTLMSFLLCSPTSFEAPPPRKCDKSSPFFACFVPP